MLNIPTSDNRYKALAEGRSIWSVLIKIEFPSGTDYLCSAPIDIEVESQTWRADSDLIGISPVGPDTEQQQDTFTVTFADPVAPGRNRWIDEFTASGYIGIPITAGLTFYYSNSWTAQLQIYSGKCTGVSEGVGGDGLVTSAEFSGPLTKVDDSSPLVISKSSQRNLLSTDTFMDYAHLAREIQFGRLADKKD